MAALAAEEDFPAGQDVVREGEPGSAFYVILDGRLDILVGDQRIDTRGPGDFFGEIALIAHGTRTATVRAATPVRTLAIRARPFRALLGREPQLLDKVVEAIHDRIPRSAPQASGET